jgi:YD repeat-containing protein
MIKLKHLFEYQEFLNEAKNTYQVKVNDKNVGPAGDYRSTGQIFKQAVESGKEGDEVVMYKTHDNKGNEVNAVSRQKTLGKATIPKKKTTPKTTLTKGKEPKEAAGASEFKLAIKEHILDMFEPPAKNVEYEYDSEGRPTRVTALVSAKDCVHTLDVDRILREYSFGVSKKRPYIAKVSDCKIDEETMAKANQAIKEGAPEDERIYKVTYDIKYEKNPDYGLTEDPEKKAEREEKERRQAEKEAAKKDEEDMSEEEKAKAAEEAAQKEKD